MSEHTTNTHRPFHVHEPGSSLLLRAFSEICPQPLDETVPLSKTALVERVGANDWGRGGG